MRHARLHCFRCAAGQKLLDCLPWTASKASLPLFSWIPCLSVPCPTAAVQLGRRCAKWLGFDNGFVHDDPFWCVSAAWARSGVPCDGSGMPKCHTLTELKPRTNPSAAGTAFFLWTSAIRPLPALMQLLSSSRCLALARQAFPHHSQPRPQTWPPRHPQQPPPPHHPHPRAPAAA
jgi:hypothetical protein